jgi:hypothetical protein
MFVIGTIVMLALVGLVRATLVHRYASQIRGKDIKEELSNTLAFARNHPVVGRFLIGFWVAQYLLVLMLLIFLVWGTPHST